MSGSRKNIDSEQFADLLNITEDEEGSTTKNGAISNQCSNGMVEFEDKSGMANTEGNLEKYMPPRLLIVSSRAKNIPSMTRALRPNVVMVQYKYENSTLDGILGLVAQALGSKKVETIAFVLHGAGSSIYICAEGEKVISAESIIEQVSVREFFTTLVSNHLDFSWVNIRIDFLSCPAAEVVEGGLIANEIETLFPTEVSVGISLDLLGSGVPLCRIGVDEEDNQTVGGLYFQLDLLLGGGKVRSKIQQSTAGYEKIRLVGKGAFGAAVLYRRKDDDSLVVLKEINMHDLTSQERQLALNEVSVLSKLEHPNIISYYDSFEEDGLLMIEMEYADGGTLAQYLAKRDRPLEEREILQLFQQMVSAVRYLHQNNVLHRDLKTANIFLSKEKNVKVGDFGISKVMSTQTKQRGATTILGTPYYISPEMCEGKPYDEKSDVWALGCILYEMACLQKTFEGSNLPALVNKIMKGQYDQVRGNYSSEFKALIGDMLRKEPDARPTAHELLYHRLLELLSRYDGGTFPPDFKEEDNLSSTDSGRKHNQKTRIRSVLYFFDPVGHSLCIVKGLPVKIRIKQMSLSVTHQLVVSTEKLVYAWGDNSWGQLGVGDRIHRSTPCLVQILTGKSISKVGAGQCFSVFCSDNGIVMTCGRAQFIGQGPLESDLLRPRLVDSLLSMDILDVSCGQKHAVAVGEGGKVFVWGKGEDGRLGTGTLQNEVTPVELEIPPSWIVRYARCGLDGTVLLTDAGSLLAMGSNQYNKLNLNQRRGFFSNLKLTKTEVDRAIVPTPIKNFGARVVDVSLGRNHSAVLLETGQIYTFGKNSDGQLGRGNTQETDGPVFVKSFAEKACVMVQCGEDFTLAATADHSLFFWGKRQSEAQLGDETDKKPEDESLLSSTAGTKSVAIVHPFNEAPERTELVDASTEQQDPDRSRIKAGSVTSESTELTDLSSSMSSSAANRGWPLRRKTISSSEMLRCILQPQHILRLDSSGGSSSFQQRITLGSVVCHRSEVFVNIETAAPLPKRPNRKRHGKTKGTLFQKIQPNAAVNQLTKISERILNRSEDTVQELETKIPTWVRKELDEAEILEDPSNKADKQQQKVLRGRCEEDVAKNKQNSIQVLGIPDTCSSSSDDTDRERLLRKKRSRSRIRQGKEELERLRQAKAETEAKLVSLEAEHKKQEEKHGQQAKQRETAMQKEIETLRGQLGAQRDHLETHFSQLKILQEKMEELQSNKKTSWNEETKSETALPSQETNHRPARSRLCNLQ